MAGEKMARAQSLTDLPDEIIQQVLFYISPEDALAVQRASRRLARLANEPLLWRYHCLTSFKYWDSKHRIMQKFAGNVTDVDWKKIYFYRRDVDIQTSRILNSILAGQIKRIEKFEQISQFGYDAKDTLLRHCAADDAVDDVLARRYVRSLRLVLVLSIEH
jgi:F-box protein 21